jgi:hypothetical protein
MKKITNKNVIPLKEYILLSKSFLTFEKLNTPYRKYSNKKTNTTRSADNSMGPTLKVIYLGMIM